MVGFQDLIDAAHAYISKKSQQRAGEVVGLTQEMVSSYLRMLEKRVGYQVFERQEKYDIVRPYSTDAGRDLLSRNPPRWETGAIGQPMNT